MALHAGPSGRDGDDSAAVTVRSTQFLFTSQVVAMPQTVSKMSRPSSNRSRLPLRESSACSAAASTGPPVRRGPGSPVRVRLSSPDRVPQRSFPSRSGVNRGVDVDRCNRWYGNRLADFKSVMYTDQDGTQSRVLAAHESCTVRPANETDVRSHALRHRRRMRRIGIQSHRA